MKKFIIICSLTAVIVACGFKGPLVLPKQNNQPQPTPNQFAPNYDKESGLESAITESSNAVDEQPEPLYSFQ